MRKVHACAGADGSCCEIRWPVLECHLTDVVCGGSYCCVAIASIDLEMILTHPGVKVKTSQGLPCLELGCGADSFGVQRREETEMETEMETGTEAMQRIKR